jgi:FMN phosphatase YigB (HAD superfamily)
MVQAVTFDFWNTLMWEEPGSLREHRLAVWAETLARVGADYDAVSVQAAHDAAHRAYEDAWRANRQFRVEEAAAQIVGELRGDDPGRTAEVLAAGFSEAGRRAAIHPSDGVGECLRELKGAGIRLGIICDIGLTPSAVVRELLDRHGLLELFDGATFSDEAGFYKPAPEVFDAALAELGGVAPDRAAHVGDRRRTDVGGALAAGWTAVRYNAVFEDPATDLPDAHLVTGDLAELPGLLGVSQVAR